MRVCSAAGLVGRRGALLAARSHSRRAALGVTHTGVCAGVKVLPTELPGYIFPSPRARVGRVHDHLPRDGDEGRLLCG